PEEVGGPMSTRLQALVDYLAGGEGEAVEQIRAGLDDPAGETSRFLEETQRLSRTLFDEEALGVLGLPPDPVPEQATRPPAPPRPSAPGAWPGVIPWLISAAASVLLFLFWQDYRERQDELESALRRLEGRRPAEAVNAPRRQEKPAPPALDRKALQQAL